jgi:hypothetical protein
MAIIIKANIRDKPTTLKKDLACLSMILFEGSEPITF